MDSVDLSIVIPVFNAESTIAHVVERVCETFSDTKLEILLVNDGSSMGRR